MRTDDCYRCPTRMTLVVTGIRLRDAAANLEARMHDAEWMATRAETPDGAEEWATEADICGAALAAYRVQLAALCATLRAIGDGEKIELYGFATA
jgi:hypothetical protein